MAVFTSKLICVVIAVAVLKEVFGTASGDNGSDRGYIKKNSKEKAGGNDERSKKKGANSHTENPNPNVKQSAENPSSSRKNKRTDPFACRLAMDMLHLELTEKLKNSKPVGCLPILRQEVKLSREEYEEKALGFINLILQLVSEYKNRVGECLLDWQKQELQHMFSFLEKSQASKEKKDQLEEARREYEELKEPEDDKEPMGNRHVFGSFNKISDVCVSYMQGKFPHKGGEGENPVADGEIPSRRAAGMKKFLRSSNYFDFINKNDILTYSPKSLIVSKDNICSLFDILKLVVYTFEAIRSANTVFIVASTTIGRGLQILSSENPLESFICGDNQVKNKYLSDMMHYLFMEQVDIKAAVENRKRFYKENPNSVLTCDKNSRLVDLGEVYGTLDKMLADLNWVKQGIVDDQAATKKNLAEDAPKA